MKYVIPKGTEVMRAPDDDRTAFAGSYTLKADAVCVDKPRVITTEGVAFIECDGWVYQVHESKLEVRL